MGNLYKEMGEYDRALSRLEKALEGYELAFGEFYPLTLATFYNMSLTYKLWIGLITLF
jgi:hypothetical protein